MCLYMLFVFCIEVYIMVFCVCICMCLYILCVSCIEVYIYGFYVCICMCLYMLYVYVCVYACVQLWLSLMYTPVFRVELHVVSEEEKDADNLPVKFMALEQLGYFLHALLNMSKGYHSYINIFSCMRSAAQHSPSNGFGIHSCTIYNK